MTQWLKAFNQCLPYICPLLTKAFSLKGSRLYFLLFFIGFLAIFLFSIRLGTIETTWDSVIASLLHRNPENLASNLIWNVRLPRFLMACLAGGVLAMAGQGMQIVVRNPLADPYTMGTASGAALGVNLATLGWLPNFYSQFYYIPFWGFIGSMISSVLVLSLSKKKVDNGTLLLIGVAVSILANSLLSLLTYYAARQTEVRHLLFWAFGNLDKSDWNSFYFALSFSSLGLLTLWLGSSSWNMLLLGDEKADSIRLNSSKTKFALLTICAFLTATIVCLIGPIGFVGLVVPFWARKLIPVTRHGFWPLTFLVGALFLSLCDLISRVAFKPFGLPIGLITSLIGIPFFLYLLRDSQKKSSF
jgi:iron complex transport system permease protein